MYGVPSTQWLNTNKWQEDTTVSLDGTWNQCITRDRPANYQSDAVLAQESPTIHIRVYLREMETYVHTAMYT